MGKYLNIEGLRCFLANLYAKYISVIEAKMAAVERRTTTNEAKIQTTIENSESFDNRLTNIEESSPIIMTQDEYDNLDSYEDKLYFIKES